MFRTFFSRAPQTGHFTRDRISSVSRQLISRSTRPESSEQPQPRLPDAIPFVAFHVLLDERLEPSLAVNDLPRAEHPNEARPHAVVARDPIRRHRGAERDLAILRFL